MDSSADRVTFELLELSLAQDVELGAFTDEELVGLDGLETGPIVPSPWYMGLSEDERDVALSAALRGLTARGLYEATPVDEATGAVRWLLEPRLKAALDLRRRAERIVVLERATSRGVDWFIARAQGRGAWQLETVDVVGYHRLALTAGDRVAARALTWLGADPHPAIVFDRVTSAELTEEEAADRLAPLADTLAAVTASTVTPGQDAQAPRGFFAGPTANFLSEHVDGGVRYWSVTAQEWTDAVTALFEG